jgi:hypothetical protein
MVKSYNLPDISARYNLYSAGLLSALSNTNRDWKLIAFNVHSLNTLLTDRFTIPVSNELFQDRTCIQQTRTCQFCIEKNFKTIVDDEGNHSKEYFETQSKIPVKEIRVYEEHLTGVLSVLSNWGGKQVTQKVQRCWNCPKCNNKNRVSDTPTSDKRYGSTATFGVMYEQPKWTVMRRSSIDRLNMEWVTDYLREIDVGLMAYQRSYFDEHGQNMEHEIQPFKHEVQN